MVYGISGTDWTPGGIPDGYEVALDESGVWGGERDNCRVVTKTDTTTDGSVQIGTSTGFYASIASTVEIVY